MSRRSGRRPRRDRPSSRDWLYRGGFQPRAVAEPRALLCRGGPCMRRILVDAARTRQSLKRGGDQTRVDLDGILAFADAPNIDLVALDQALNGLANVDARRGQVVELRFFAGLSVEETAEVLEVSAETVMRDWKVARAWGIQPAQSDRASPLTSAIPGGTARGFTWSGSTRESVTSPTTATCALTGAPLANGPHARRSGARAAPGISGTADPRCCGRSGRTTCPLPTVSAARARRWRRAQGSGQHSWTSSSSQSGRGHRAVASGGPERTSANTTAARRISSSVPMVIRAW